MIVTSILTVSSRDSHFVALTVAMLDCILHHSITVSVNAELHR